MACVNVHEFKVNMVGGDAYVQCKCSLFGETEDFMKLMSG